MSYSIVALLILAFIAIAFLMSRLGGGRPGGTDSTDFPYNSGSTIAPPSWSSDSGVSDTQCDTSDGGWSDSGSDSCDSGDSGSGGND